MRIIETGKHKGKILADCPREYIEWAAKHEKNFAERNRWISRDARFILERKAVAEVAKVALQQVEKTAQRVSSPTEDRMMKAALTTNRGFQLMR